MANESNCGEGNGFVINASNEFCSFCFRKPIIGNLNTITEKELYKVYKKECCRRCFNDYSGNGEKQDTITYSYGKSE